jgi:hypothetical protein
MNDTRKIIIFPTARIRNVDGVEESEIRKNLDGEEGRSTRRKDIAQN